MGIFILLAIAIAMFWLYTIIDIAKSSFVKPSDRIFWFMMVLIIAPLGLALYWTTAKKLKSVKKVKGTLKDKELDEIYRNYLEEKREEPKPF